MLESRITALEAIAVPTAVLPKSNALSSPTTAVIPSNTFSSVAVEVTATSSFIFGEVNVLFVRVAVEAVETKRASPPVPGMSKYL